MLKVLEGVAKRLRFAHDKPIVHNEAVNTAANVTPTKRMTSYITTKEAAQLAGVTDGYIRLLLGRGTLKGKRFGRDWLVSRKSVEQFAQTERKPGPKPS
jgi:excisionase family DNA binding protein